MRKERRVKYLTIYAAYILIVWGFYRVLFKLPDNVEETVLKPIIWLVPIFFILKKERLSLCSLGITYKNLFPAIYLSLGLGAIFAIEAIFLNFLKYKTFNFGANMGEGGLVLSLMISFATAFSEEVSFRGYIFNRLWGVLNNEWLANIITSIVWTLVHVPITIFVWKLSLSAAILYLFLTLLFGMGSAFVFARTKNVFSSIFLHVLWQWPII
ncbi:MAG: CPBP family intramembrane glutamic endopeptidase, partial [Patescibacteria group bacterium]